MKRRLFIAIPASWSLRKTVSDWRQRHRDDFSGVRWTPSQNLHVTLLPPKQVTEEWEAKKGLRKIDFRNFWINLRKIEVVRRRSPQVIWARVTFNEELRKLREQIEEIFNFKEPRPPKPHVTLGKIRSSYLVSYQESINWWEEVKMLVLIESKLTPAGSEYTILDVVCAGD
jgi:2'-5' RNA ligase